MLKRTDTLLLLLIRSLASRTENYSYILCISQQFGEKKSSYVQIREHAEVNLQYQHRFIKSLTCIIIQTKLFALSGILEFIKDNEREDLFIKV